jgi:hypothetical protein
MMMRYAMLVAMAAASVWGLFDVSMARVPMFLVDAGQTGATGPSSASGDVAFWLLASIATLITLSLGRFVFFGLPSMIGGWYQEHKNWIFALIGGGLLYAVFYVR